MDCSSLSIRSDWVERCRAGLELQVREAFSVSSSALAPSLIELGEDDREVAGARRQQGAVGDEVTRGSERCVPDKDAVALGQLGCDLRGGIVARDGDVAERAEDQ